MASSTSQLWFIAREDLRQMLRAKETLLWVFVMPIVFMYFIGTVTGGMGRSGGTSDRPDPLAFYAPSDAGFLADEIQSRLEEQNFRVIRPPDPDATYYRQLHLPDLAEGHADFTAQVLAGEQAMLNFVRIHEGEAAQFDQVRVARAVYTVLADLAACTASGDGVDRAGFAALRAMPRNLQLEVESAGKRIVPPEGFNQTVPGTMVMFTMLVMLTGGAITLVIERNQGLLRRLASAPISRGTLVAGKWVGKMALALVQVGFALLVGTFGFGIDWGSAFWMVCLVLLAWASFNASLGMLLASIARTEPQMSGLGVVTTMALAALGGCWWPIEITPQWMQDLALCLPTGWAMDAMHQLVNFGNDAPVALPHVLGLGVGTLVLGWLAARRFRYE